MQTPDLVTIVIPTYNRETLVPRAIASVLAQSYPNIEVMVVDDGSRDHSTEAVLAIAESDSRVRLVRHTSNYGQNAALNTGICFCTGTYVGFCDSDDTLLPDFVEKFVSKFQSDSELGAVYSRKFVKLGHREPVVAVPFTLEGHVYPQTLAQGHLSHMGTIMVKRECFKRTRVFDINFTNHQDDDFCFLVAKHYKVGLIPEALAIEFNEGLADRVTDNRLDYAQGFRRFIIKHADEILELAGPDAMIHHLNKSARLFLEVGDPHAATRLLTDCTDLFNKTVQSGVAPLEAVASIVPNRSVLREQLIANVERCNAILTRK